jgi:hypothetical protein
LLTKLIVARNAPIPWVAVLGPRMTSIRSMSSSASGKSLPVDPAQGRVVHRAAVDEHLKPREELAAEPVIGHDRLRALDLRGIRHGEAGNQAEQLGDLAHAGCADGVLVDHGDRVRRIGDVLAQARRGQDRGEVGEELALGQVLRDGRDAVPRDAEERTRNPGRPRSGHRALHSHVHLEPGSGGSGHCFD